MNIKTMWSLIKDTFDEWQEDKATRLAAALAYYTVFSLAPLVIIVLGITGYIFGSQDVVGAYLIEQVQGLVGQEGAEIFQTIIENADQPTSSIVAALIGIGTLLFGAIGVFGGLQDALNTVWGVTSKPGRGIWDFIETRLLSFTMVLGIGFLLLVSLVLSSLLSALDGFLANWLSDFSVLAIHVINFAVSFGVITLLFAMIYKILPDVEIDWSDVWMGAAVTALLFSIGKFLLGFYLGRQTFGSTYGAAGSILIILLWVYYSAQILLFGAEFTQVYAKRFGRIVPDEDAVVITPEMRAKQGIPRSEEVAAAVRIQEQGQQPSVPARSAKPVERASARQIVRVNNASSVAAELKPNRLVTLLLGLFFFGWFIKKAWVGPKG